MRGDCQGHLAPAPPRYDTANHALWYKRFWTGGCDPQIPRCIPGQPNWNNMVTTLLNRSPAAQRPAVLAKACRVGELIGVEWSRSKTIRKIDLGDLRAFNRELESSSDTLQGLDRLEASARAKLAGR
ncbi:hypothetical protein [Caulobacter sp.]|uniref:hypothetical protein n=1 Tax=Caulobacter sp. TaxID=78 RepID=UPI0025BC4869|nr:hypothetical protein [Caulobacter sp.]